MKSRKIFPFIVCLFITQMLMAQSQEVSDLTNTYYGIKNALVAGDGKTASIQAEAFLKALNALSLSSVDPSQQKTWQEQNSKMKSTSEAIANTTDVTKQREQLNDLSIALFASLKAYKGTESVVYYQYCPMMKAYWLSHEKEIKNPYYGDKMLTCGIVSEILK